MAYSISYELQPKFLEFLQANSGYFPVLFEQFREPWQQQLSADAVSGERYLFGYLKPRPENGLDKRDRFLLFSELAKVAELGYLRELTADKCISEKPILEQVRDRFPSLIPFVVQEL